MNNRLNLDEIRKVCDEEGWLMPSQQVLDNAQRVIDLVLSDGRYRFDANPKNWSFEDDCAKHDTWTDISIRGKNLLALVLCYEKGSMLTRTWREDGLGHVDAHYANIDDFNASTFANDMAACEDWVNPVSSRIDLDEIKRLLPRRLPMPEQQVIDNAQYVVDLVAPSGYQYSVRPSVWARGYDDFADTSALNIHISSVNLRATVWCNGRGAITTWIGNKNLQWKGEQVTFYDGIEDFNAAKFANDMALFNEEVNDNA